MIYAIKVNGAIAKTNGHLIVYDDITDARAHAHTLRRSGLKPELVYLAERSTYETNP